MPVINDSYDQLKLDKLKYYLEDMSTKGHPRPYEIFVDSLKVVPKTEDPKDFDSFEFYVNENTEKIRILIYNSNLSPRNDQYCFYVQQQKLGSLQQQPMNGLGEIDTIIQEKLSARDREHEMSRLRHEIEETKKQLEEAEEYAESLEKELEDAKSNKYKLGKLDLVELGGAVLEKLAVRNSPALQKIGLGSLVSPNGASDPEQGQETLVSYQKKDDEGTHSSLSADQLRYLPLLQQLDDAFDKTQLNTIMQIISKFSESPDKVNIVADLLNIKTP